MKQKLWSLCMMRGKRRNRAIKAQRVYSAVARSTSKTHWPTKRKASTLFLLTKNCCWCFFVSSLILLEQQVTAKWIVTVRDKKVWSGMCVAKRYRKKHCTTHSIWYIVVWLRYQSNVIISTYTKTTEKKRRVGKKSVFESVFMYTNVCNRMNGKAVKWKRKKCFLNWYNKLGTGKAAQKKEEMSVYVVGMNVASMNRYRNWKV